jgi:hypothetical protein
MKFMDGLHRTIDWYFQTKNRHQVQRVLEQILTERTVKDPGLVKKAIRLD